MISIGGTSYVRQSDGGWEKGASVQELQTRYGEKRKRAFDCGYVNDEIVVGDVTALKKKGRSIVSLRSATP